MVLSLGYARSLNTFKTKKKKEKKKNMLVLNNAKCTFGSLEVQLVFAGWCVVSSSAPWQFGGVVFIAVFFGRFWRCASASCWSCSLGWSVVLCCAVLVRLQQCNQVTSLWLFTAQPVVFSAIGFGGEVEICVCWFCMYNFASLLGGL